MAWEPKSPFEILDYYMDWTKDLQSNETIANSDWTVDDGVTVTQESWDDTKAVIWVTGGEKGRNYTLLNQIVTNQGRSMEKSNPLRVRNR